MKGSLLFCTAILFSIVSKCNCNNHNENEIFAKTEILASPESCQNSNVSLLILIHSAPFHFDLRKSQRDTWTQNNPDARRVFIIGHSADASLEEKVLKEIEDEKDILFIDIVDSYRNLTLKHIIGYEWAIAECSNTGTNSYLSVGINCPFK
jgi:hypothetical protein